MQSNTVWLTKTSPVGYNIQVMHACLQVAGSKSGLSLVPRPPPFLPSVCVSVCVHNNTQERKTSEERERPGSIHRVSEHEVDVGGEVFKYIRTKLESEFLTGQDK